MILAASNIAWWYEERLAAYDLMQAQGLKGLEIAPGLFFSQAADPFAPDEETAALALREIGARGLSLVSMQSLLFGVAGAALFGETDAQALFERGMNRAVDLAGRFGIPNLVFGSPTQRQIPPTLPRQVAWDQAVMVFRRLGDRAQQAGTVIAMEANPVAYGTNFLNTLDEVLDFVAQVGHPAIGLNLDLGAMHMNGTHDTVVGRLAEIGPHLLHVHVSEPDLSPAPRDVATLEPVLTALKAQGYRRAVSIEMKRDALGLAGLQSRFEALVCALEGGRS